MKFILDRAHAKEILDWANQQNPGPWMDHSINVAKATENILLDLNKQGHNLDVDLGYNAALIHDIGRYKGFTKSVVHSYDGYMYLKELGYIGNAIICVTHSFPCQNENLDVAAEWQLIPSYMKQVMVEVLQENSPYDIYNKIITLCDALADAGGFTMLEKRLISVGLRHGTTTNTSLHWRGFYTIKNELETLLGKSVYELLPGIEKSFYSTVDF